jgi:hypothetical protein
MSQPPAGGHRAVPNRIGMRRSYERPGEIRTNQVARAGRMVRPMNSADSMRMIPIANPAPISIVRRAPPTAFCSSVSLQRKRTKPSPSLFRSTEEQRSPESCSSFRSREEPHAGFTTVVLGCRMWATLGGPPPRYLAQPSCGARRCRRTGACKRRSMGRTNLL